MKIRLFKPHLEKDELNAVKEVFDKSWILIDSSSEYSDNIFASIFAPFLSTLIRE